MQTRVYVLKDITYKMYYSDHLSVGCFTENITDATFFQNEDFAKNRAEMIETCIDIKTTIVPLTIIEETEG